MRGLVLFDLDGTLLDTLDDLAAACNHALSVCGFAPHAPEAYRHFVGDGARNMVIRAIGSNADAATADRVEAAFRAYYARHAADLTKPYDGIARLLREIRRAGVGAAILSNKPDSFVGALARRYFPGLFDSARGQREGVPLKPSPAGVFMVLEELGVKPRDAVFVGDSAVDIATGHAAGMPAVGVVWGFRTKDELEKAGADSIVDNVEQLGKILVDFFGASGYTE